MVKLIQVFGRRWQRQSVPDSVLRCERKSAPSVAWFGGGYRKTVLGVCHLHKLQALVYDILPSTTAVFSYAIGPENEQFCVGA